MSTMAFIGPGAYKAATTQKREDANKAPLGMLGDIEAMIKSYRGDATALRATIQVTALTLMATAAALSLIPFEANFGGELAARLMHQMIGPGIQMAINAPLRDYLDNVFPTREISARLLVTGLENGALTDQDVVEALIDSGVKDPYIKQVIKIARVTAFEKDTRDDLSIVKQYHTALINEQVANGTADINDAITARKARIKDLQAQLKLTSKGTPAA